MPSIINDATSAKIWHLVGISDVRKLKYEEILETLQDMLEDSSDNYFCVQNHPVLLHLFRMSLIS